MSKKKRIKQYVKEIYKEVEVCPHCGTLMKRINMIYPVSPPQYGWECPKCKKRTISTNSGELQFVLEKVKK